MPTTRLTLFSMAGHDDLWEHAEEMDAQRSQLGGSVQAFDAKFLFGFEGDDVKDAKDTSSPVMPWERASFADEKETLEGNPLKKSTRTSVASTECPSSFMSFAFDSDDSQSGMPPSLGQSFKEGMAQAGDGTPVQSTPPQWSQASLAAVSVEALELLPEIFKANDLDIPMPPSKDACTQGMDCSLLSRGSRFHHIGQCTPCKFFRGNRGCRDAEHCTMCHHPHEELTYSAIRRGLKKKAIEKQQWLDSLTEQVPGGTAEETPVNFDDIDTDVPPPMPPSAEPVLISFATLSANYVMSF